MIQIFIYGIPGYDSDAILRVFQISTDGPFLTIHGNGINVTNVLPSEFKRQLKLHGENPQVERICIIFVIKKDRIREEIHRLQKSELNLIFSGLLPVILLITDCNSDNDQNWWLANGKHFEPYGIMNNFVQIMHGSTTLQSRRWEVTQRSVLEAVYQHSRTNNIQEIFRNVYYERMLSVYTNVSTFLRRRHRVLIGVLVPCILLSILTPKIMDWVKQQHSGTVSEFTLPKLSLDDLVNLLNIQSVEISGLKSRVENLEEQVSRNRISLTTISTFYEKIKSLFNN